MEPGVGPGLNAFGKMSRLAFFFFFFLSSISCFELDQSPDDVSDLHLGWEMRSVWTCDA